MDKFKPLPEFTRYRPWLAEMLEADQKAMEFGEKKLPKTPFPYK